MDVPGGCPFGSHARAAGGRFEVADVLCRSSSTTARSNFQLTVVGSGFNYPMFEPVTDFAGTLTGTLRDGHDFTWTFDRDADSSIVLVPEPSVRLLTGLGFLVLFNFRRTKKGRCTFVTTQTGHLTIPR